MQIKVLYKYTRPDGGITTAMTPPQGEYLTVYRLIADDGMFLQKDGGDLFKVIDVEDVSGWVEGIVEETIPEPEQEPQPPRILVVNPPIDTSIVTISEVEYLEWINYKKRMETVERKIANVMTTVGGAALQLQELEDLL